MNIRSIIDLQEIVTRFVIGKILMDAMYKRLAIQQRKCISYRFVVDAIIGMIISLLTKTF